MNMSDEKEWEYWNEIEAFQLYQGIYLQQGVLPPKSLDYLLSEEKEDWYHCIKTMAEFEHEFNLVFKSLCTDSEIGNELRGLSNEKAAYWIIPKKIFIHHWKKCGFPINTALRTGKRGRTAQLDMNKLIVMAKKFAAENRDYDYLLKQARKEFECGDKTVRNNYSKKQYMQLLENSRK